MGGVRKNALWRCAVVAFAVSGWIVQAPCQTPLRGGDRPKVTITLRVYDYAHLARPILKESEVEAGDIFSQSGIQADWLDSAPGQRETSPASDCRRAIGSGDLIINILPRTMTLRSHSRDTILGTAYVARDGASGSVASVFFDRIVAFSLRANVAPHRVLANVMAHEAGHLLLGENSHGSQGLMRGEWEMRDLESMGRSDLEFSAPQAERLRTKAIDRLRLAATSGDR